MTVRIKRAFHTIDFFRRLLPKTFNTAEGEVDVELVKRLPRLSATQMAQDEGELPKPCTMLTREFIQNSLYHPTRGYFSTLANIVSPLKEEQGEEEEEEGFQFPQIKDSLEFLNLLAKRYKQEQPDRQSWHTPSEIFRPWYGQAVANYLMTEYLLQSYPQHDLMIYELGAGNGTLMRDVLDYLQQQEPQVYARTKYHVIEASPIFAKIQQSRLRKHQDKVHIEHKSIFDWSCQMVEPCFVLAMEVIDNFAHDLLLSEDGQVKQGAVYITPEGEFKQYYEPLNDALCKKYLDRYGAVTNEEFFPTNAYRLLDVLTKYFPLHRLVLSDFSYLPNTISQIKQAPVVQTRHQGTMIPVRTYLVQPGHFDIFFPTDFNMLAQMYQRTKQAGSTRLMTHRQFLQQWTTDLSKTSTRSGENVMLDWYENVHFLLT